MKVCKTCYIEKPLTEFYSDMRRKDGHFPSCKICANDQHRRLEKAKKKSCPVYKAGRFEP